MANLKSSKQDVKKSAERHMLNQGYRGRMRGSVRRARTAIDGGPGDRTQAVSAAMSLIDRAASRGAIHRNAAARRKSRLALRLNRSLAAH